MKEYLKIVDTEILYSTRLFEVMRQKVEYQKKGEKGVYTTEIVSRPPGVRLLITDIDKILLTKEYRFELDAWDYRLPGGRVFDNMSKFVEIRHNKRKLNSSIKSAAIKEAIEEAGIKPINLDLIHLDKLGASVFWDLYFFHVDKFEDVGQKPSHEGNDIGEIIYPEWFSFDTVLKMILNNQISETRSSGFLLKFMLKEKNDYL